jgi:hypothetical protein
MLFGGIQMKRAFVVACAVTAQCAGLAAAEEFPPKPETIKQIVLGTVGGVVLPQREPRGSATTITSTSSFRGNSISTSDTFDSTPERPHQVIRIINKSIYDLKDIEIDCAYFAESGTRVGGTISQKFLLVFPASARRDVVLNAAPILPEATQIGCSIKDLEYIGIGAPAPEPPPPQHDGRSWITDTSGRPLVYDLTRPKLN